MKLRGHVGCCSCREQLQWSASDWPADGRPDARGGIVGGKVLVRLELLTPLQVCYQHTCAKKEYTLDVNPGEVVGEVLVQLELLTPIQMLPAVCTGSTVTNRGWCHLSEGLVADKALVWLELLALLQVCHHSLYHYCATL